MPDGLILMPRTHVVERELTPFKMSSVFHTNAVADPPPQHTHALTEKEKNQNEKMIPNIHNKYDTK